MICAKCQNELKPDAKFCGKCGTLVDSSTAEGTVILPNASSSSAGQHVSDLASMDAEGMADILSRSRTEPTAVSPSVMNLSGPPTQPEEGVRMPPLSLALEFEQQFGSAEEIEKKGRTVVAAIFAAIAALALIAGAVWWFGTKSRASVTSAPLEASAPVSVESAPVVAPLPENSPVVSETTQAVASVPVAAEPVAVKPEVAASKPASKSVRKLSEEDEYLRQIRRQLDREH